MAYQFYVTIKGRKQGQFFESYLPAAQVGVTLSSLALGWVGVVVFPQILDRVGVGGTTLLLVGGVAYTLGALVYALKRPDPVPGVFGYHEVFHAFVIVAVGFQYAAVAFFVLPQH